jgi:hypothetical protein
MPDELLAGQDTPAVPSEAPKTEPAQPNAGTDAPGAETDGVEKEPQNEPKTLTLTEEELRDRIERATAKASAKAERRALRQAHEMLMQTAGRPQQPTQQQDDRPRREAFASDDEYFDKLTDWKLEQRDSRQKASTQMEQQRSMSERTEKIYAEAEKLSGMDRDDLDEVVGKFTPVIAQALVESDVSAKLLTHMASHPEDLQRITALSPARQAAEIGKLETRLANVAKPPRTPAPIEPVGGGQSPIKSLASMSADEYYAARMKQRPGWAR